LDVAIIPDGFHANESPYIGFFANSDVKQEND
jgi:hypothetical protein